MRRRSVLKGLEQKAEPFLGLLRLQPYYIKYFFLQILFMNTYGTAADLIAVQNKVIRTGPDLGIFALFQTRNILFMQRRKRMMLTVPAFFFLIIFEQREIDNPKKRKFIFVFARIRLVAFMIPHRLCMGHARK